MTLDDLFLSDSLFDKIAYWNSTNSPPRCAIIEKVVCPSWKGHSCTLATSSSARPDRSMPLDCRGKVSEKLLVL